MKPQRLFVLVLVSLVLGACGQRAHIQKPEGHVQDSSSF